MHSKTDRASIIGVGAVLPEDTITTAEQFAPVAKKYGLRDSAIQSISGIKSRHRAPSDVKASDLATRSALIALEHAGITAAHLGAVYFAGVYKDHDEPATAHKVARNIGVMPYCERHDMRDACNSIAVAIKAAAAFVDTGQANYALVCTGELGTRQADLASRLLIKRPIKAKLLRHCLASFTLGDIGGALIIGRPSGGLYLRMSPWEYRSDSSAYAMSRVGNVSKDVLRADSKKLHAAALPLASEVVHRVLQRERLRDMDIDHLIIHQTSKDAIESHKSLLFVSESCVTPHYQTTGNLISASLIFGLHLVWGKIRTGDNILASLQAGGISAYAVLMRAQLDAD